MQPMFLVNTTRFHRRKLPHWEIQGGEYHITARLGDSLPKTAVESLQLLQPEISAVRPDSKMVRQLQRPVFQTMEKYLETGMGACVLRDDKVAAIVAEELGALQAWGIVVPHYSIMPNHFHALMVPGAKDEHPLSAVMKRIKGRTGHRIRRLIGGMGPVWQREWFDHWIRDETERDRVIDYIHQNPAKANLVSRWQDHRWTK